MKPLLGLHQQWYCIIGVTLIFLPIFILLLFQAAERAAGLRAEGQGLSMQTTSGSTFHKIDVLVENTWQEVTEVYAACIKDITTWNEHLVHRFMRETQPFTYLDHRSAGLKVNVNINNWGGGVERKYPGWKVDNFYGVEFNLFVFNLCNVLWLQLYLFSKPPLCSKLLGKGEKHHSALRAEGQKSRDLEINPQWQPVSHYIYSLSAHPVVKWMFLLLPSLRAQVELYEMQWQREL